MKRQTAREIAVQIICGADVAGSRVSDFAETFMDRDHYSTLSEECDVFSEYPDEKSSGYINSVIGAVDGHRSDIDAYISTYSKGWSIQRISSVSRAILRTAICEILYFEDIPVASSINSAVEIAKQYEDPDGVAFINGILGGFVRGEGIDSKRPE